MLCQGYPVSVDLIEPVILVVQEKSEVKRAYEVVRLVGLHRTRLSHQAHQVLLNKLSMHQLVREMAEMQKDHELSSEESIEPYHRMSFHQIYHDTKLKMEESDESKEGIKAQILNLLGCET